MNSAYTGKKLIVFIQRRNDNVYSGKKLIVFIQGRNE
jgi:hypothetical protein